MSAPLIEAAFALGADPLAHVTAVVEVGDRHPMEIAEEVAVVRLLGAKRLTLAFRPAPGTEERFQEAVTLVETALDRLDGRE